MAGDWIKMRVGLTTHPRVMRIAECLLDSAPFAEWAGLACSLGGYPPPSESESRAERHSALRITRYVTVTALLRFWGYANEHAKGDEVLGVWPEDVDEVTGVPGFADAIETAGWVKFDRENGGLKMPNFEEHNTSSSERSSAGAERQKRYRERKKQQASDAPLSYVTRDVTLQEREEKRREEKKPHRGARVVPLRFDDFWAAYPGPRKFARVKCMQVWLDKGFTAVADQIILHVEAMKLTPQWKEADGKYIPAPLTYLNQQRFEDGLPDSAVPKLRAAV